MEGGAGEAQGLVEFGCQQQHEEGGAEGQLAVEQPQADADGDDGDGDQRRDGDGPRRVDGDQRSRRGGDRRRFGDRAGFGGGRRDEEKSRAKERVFSFRNAAQAWDPKNQRPEMWKLYNSQINKGESIRVFPLSNWTEKDIWQYIRRENLEIVSLYFAKERPVIERDGNLIMIDDDRIVKKLDLKPEDIEHKKVRFRTLGCYPLTGAVESDADTLDAIVEETLGAVESERTSRVIDHEGAGSMERRKREGYF